MLISLSIRNYAIIRELELRFSKGLVILTGETGSGKSILLGALGLIMGDRADSKAVYDPDKKCIIEAEFEIGPYRLQPFFEAEDLDYAERLSVRREIAPGGKSRAFVNDTPCSLSQLQALSSHLIDLHQQFDTLQLHQEQFQFSVVDAIAHNLDLLQEYQLCFRKHQQLAARISELEEEQASQLREQDFLNFQLNELSEAGLRAGEQGLLEEEQSLLAHAEDIRKHTSQAQALLSEDEQAVIPGLNQIRQWVQAVEKYHPALPDLYSRLESVLIELEDIGSELDQVSEKIELDPQRLAFVEERLNLLYKLQQKHQASSVDQLLEIATEMKSRTKRFDQLEQELETLRKAHMSNLQELDALADRLSAARKQIIPAAEDSVHTGLASLRMENARLRIAIEPADRFTQYGKEKVQFLFSTNAGGRFLPIKDIASGGELSRLALCIKSLVARELALPTMIFDEIDTGVSGLVALQMGAMLKTLADGHQVLVITHTPQVASRADQHFQVYKQTIDGVTGTQVDELDMAQRIEAIAVMLSTNPPTQAALENAKELLSVI